MKTLRLLLIAGAAVCATPAWAQVQDGKTIFANNCAACHQPTGKGIPGAFPALAGSPFVQGAARDVAGVLLLGRGGMPDFSGSLDDAEIARVLSFVRSAWGNAAAALTEQQVAALRAELHVAPAERSPFGNKH